MGSKTAISWTNSTWTPIRARAADQQSGEIKVGWHCTHASEGCRYCYSESLNLRLGTSLPFKPDQLEPRGAVNVYLDEKMLLQPQHWTKPRMIFPCSMTDIAGEFVAPEITKRMFDVMADVSRHKYQVLTKRAARLRQVALQFNPKACRHIWLGFSAEDQPNFDARWELMKPLADVGWLVWCSAEPLLGRIDASKALAEGLRWIVGGGESGRHARPMHPDWQRLLRDQCAAAGVAYFFKQWGEWLGYGAANGRQDENLGLPCEPKDHFTFPDGVTVFRVGKKAAGDFLDGVQHHEYPEV